MVKEKFGKTSKKVSKYYAIDWSFAKLIYYLQCTWNGLLLRTLLQREDGALLWIYTSDLVKFWNELYTILLILSEIWGKVSKLTSVLLVNVYAEASQVNAEALNKKSYQPRHFICRGEKCWNSRAEVFLKELQVTFQVMVGTISTKLLKAVVLSWIKSLFCC